MRKSQVEKKIWDIGHSTLSWSSFLNLLKEHEIECLVDIRRFPASRKFPHFCQKEIKGNLEKAGLEYVWMGETLGGFRRGGYEAWMKTMEFLRGLEKLEALARIKRVAVMCAERYFGRCHRRFLLQALQKRGWEIQHII